jgi:transcriptional regulator NrdR family protein
MPSKNERVELERQIRQGLRLARGMDDVTRKQLEAMVAEMEKKLREIDE